MRAILVAGGETDEGDVRWLERGELVVAVDGGANWLRARGRRPHVLVGDLDSVDPQLVRVLEADGVEVRRYPRDKDSSDMELALSFVRERDADEVLVLGAFGGPRIDHEVANLLLLSAAAGAGGRLRLVRGPASATAITGGKTLDLAGPRGSLVSLFPLGGDALGVTTFGLEYPLEDESLSTGTTRGLSNVVAEPPARVALRAGCLLVMEQHWEGEDQ